MPLRRRLGVEALRKYEFILEYIHGHSVTRVCFVAWYADP
jgi:hypothetical protein